MFGIHQERVKRTTDDIIIMLSDEEELFRKKFILDSFDVTEWKCTVCAKLTNDKPYPHPALRVSTCFDCLKTYGNAVFLANKDGTDKNCRWCTQPAKKYCCSLCTVIFCKNCIERNFDIDFVRNRVASVSDWNCFICDSKPLWRLRVECIKAMEKSTNNNNIEECEVINLISQESQENSLPVSQAALANNSEQFGVDIISSKTASQPIVESDDNDSTWTTQHQPNSINQSTDQDLSLEDKNSLLNVLQESKLEMDEFIQLFSQRVDQYSRKIQRINTHQQAEKFIKNTLNKFYNKVIENVQCMKSDSQVKYEEWNKSISKPKNKRLNGKIYDKRKSPPKTIPENNNSVIKTESKIINSNEPSTSQLARTESNIIDSNEPSTSKLTKVSQTESKINKDTSNPSTSKSGTSKAKRKYSLSLKTPSKELPKYDNNDTLVYLEKIKKTIPDDAVSPSNYSISLLNQVKSPQKTSQTLSSPINFIENDPSVASDTSIANNKTIETEEKRNNINDITITPVRRNVAKKKTGNSQRIKPSKREIAPVKIKTESAASISPLSVETIINNPVTTTIKRENHSDIEKQSIEGEKELMARILEDFSDEEVSNEMCVKIESYLCEKTGTFCSNYRTGQDSVVSEDSMPPFEFSDKENDTDTDSTEAIDWGDFVDLTKQPIEPREILEIDLTRDIQVGEINPVVKKEIKREQLSLDIEQESETTTEELAKETDSSTDSEAEAALKALDTSDLSSVSSESECDSSSQDEIQRPRIPWEPTGHVQELNIANECAKLQKNYDEECKLSDFEKSYSTGDFENSQDKILEDPKLCLNPVVELEKNYKLLLTPVVILDKIDFDNCYGLVKNGKKYSISNSEDSEEEIRRLTDLTTIRKRNILDTSSDNETVTKSPVKRKKKRLRKHRNPISSSNSDSDDSYISSKTVELEANILNTNEVDEDYIPEIPEDILNDTLTEESTEDDDVVEINTNKKKISNRRDVEEISDEDEEKSSKEDDPRASWRKDRLLTENLALGTSDDETNDSTANAIQLKREYENYVKNADSEKSEKKRRNSVQSVSSSNSEAIILSTDVDSDDSDIQFVDLKRKRESDEEGASNKNKKGRRNIREVLKDSELHEETKKADKEETERKERLSLKQKTLESLLSETQLSQEEVGFVLDMDEEKKEPIITVHHSLVPPLKDHQKKGIKFMWDVCFESVAQLKVNKGVGCILAHCMGLGKTMQVVVLGHTLLTHSQTNIKHILVVCPLSTVFNWRNEFEKTLKPCTKKIGLFDMRPHKQKNFNQKMFEVKRWREQGGVLLMGYEAFQALVNEEKFNKIDERYKKVMYESLIDPGPDVLVCDEGHMLKNGKTLRFISLSKVKTSRRIILTGTPLQNNLLEYYHMVNFVKPHLLGTLDEYKNRFVNPIMNGQYEDSNKEDIHIMKKRSHILHKKLLTTVQRYEESELAPYLPERHDYVLFFQLTPLQVELYEHYLTLLDVTTRKLFKNYHALQNIWTHPALLKIKYEKRNQPLPKKQRSYDEDYVAGWDPDKDIDALDTDWFKNILPEDVVTNMSYGLKIEVLFSVIKECEAIKEKLLVFSSSIDELDLIETFLNRQLWTKGLDYYRMDGAVPPEKRSHFCNEFNNEKNQRSRLFLVSHKVGGLGLNLTAASRVVLMDVNWNPAYDTQSVFRVYRFGQTKNCYIYRFVSLGTMEEVVYSRAVTKLAISCRVVDEHQIKRHFNEDDLQRMYRLNKDFGEPHTPTLPSDRLLAKLWETHKPQLFNFCDHQSLLENLAHEELNEEEMNLAWEEFRNEVEREKQAKEMAAQVRLQTNFTPLNGAYLPVPSGPNIPAGLSRYPLPPRLPNIQANNQFPPNYRYKRPNTLPIPVTTNFQQQAEFLRRVGYNLNYPPVSTTSNPVPSTSTASTSSDSNYQSLLNSLKQVSTVSTASNQVPSTSTASTSSVSNFQSVLNAFNQNNVSNAQNTAPNLYTANSSIANDNNYPNPFSGNSRKGKVITRNSDNININDISNLNISTGLVKIVPTNLPIGQKENVFQRTVETLNNNGVSVYPEQHLNNSKNIIEP